MPAWTCPLALFWRLLYFDDGRDVPPVALLEGDLHLVALAERLDGHTVGHGHPHPVIEHQGPVRRVDRLDLAFHFSSPGADHREHQQNCHDGTQPLRHHAFLLGRGGSPAVRKSTDASTRLQQNLTRSSAACSRPSPGAAESATRRGAVARGPTSESRR